MSKSILDMSVSLDGFVAGPNETPENGIGDNGARLHSWIAFDPEAEPVAAATTAGIRAAFFCGAIISIAAVITAFFIKKPTGRSHGVPH